MKRFIIIVFVILVSVFLTELMAQCPMCKIAAESNLENGGSAAQGLNKGILYMLMTPYILVGIIGFLWYKNRKEESIEKFDYSLNQK